MFTFDESFDYDPTYELQRDYYGRFFISIVGVILFFEFLKGQISEIDLLQLIPGLYFFLFFIFLLLSVIFANFLFRSAIQIDNLKVYGSKIESKIKMGILLKLSFFFFFCFFISCLK